MPLVAVFDRHNAAAIATNVDGGGGPWHPAFAQSILDLGIGVDLRGRGRDERSGGSVEKLVRWVKASFFGARSFADAREMQARLAEWILDVNTRSTARGTGIVPQARMTEERVRLRPMGLRVADFAPRIPVIVGPGPEVVFEGISYPMPAETLGQRAMLYLHSGRVRIVGVVSISSTSAFAVLGGQNFRNDTTPRVGTKDLLVRARVERRRAYADGQSVGRCGRKAESAGNRTAIRVRGTSREALFASGGGSDARILESQGVPSAGSKPYAVGRVDAGFGTPQSATGQPGIASNACRAARIAGPQLAADGTPRLDARRERIEESHAAGPTASRRC